MEPVAGSYVRARYSPAVHDTTMGVSTNGGIAADDETHEDDRGRRFGELLKGLGFEQWRPVAKSAHRAYQCTERSIRWGDDKANRYPNM